MLRRHLFCLHQNPTPDRHRHRGQQYRAAREPKNGASDSLVHDARDVEQGESAVHVERVLLASGASMRRLPCLGSPAVKFASGTAARRGMGAIIISVRGDRHSGVQFDRDLARRDGVEAPSRWRSPARSPPMSFAAAQRSGHQRGVAFRPRRHFLCCGREALLPIRSDSGLSGPLSAANWPLRSPR